jgi:hypothetical protein
MVFNARKAGEVSLFQGSPVSIFRVKEGKWPQAPKMSDQILTADAVIIMARSHLR